MTLGFADPAPRDALIEELRDWELHEVIVEKYSVMVLSENGSCCFTRVEGAPFDVPGAVSVWLVDDDEREHVGRGGFMNDRISARP